MQVLENYEVCYKAKQTRDPFPTLYRRSEVLFEIIHGDVWGPYGEENLCNSKFVLTLVEDHNMNIWTYVMQSKEQLCAVLESFLAMVRNHFNAHVKVFRSNNGSKFVNSIIHALLSSLGILHQKSCVYTPQQNGMVECMHKMLLNSARAMMFQTMTWLSLMDTWLLQPIYHHTKVSLPPEA